MAELFAEIAQLKEAVGGAVNQSLSLSSLEPSIRQAAALYLNPWLGDAFYADLVAWAVAGSPTAAQTAAVKYARRALGPLALYEYAPIGAVQFSDTGISRVENEHHKTAYKYQEFNWRMQMLTQGYEALELMLKFLEANQADYANWVAGSGYARNKALFLNYASEFREAYSKNVTRYVFEVLRPLIEDVEDFAIRSTLPKQFYDALKAQILAKNISAADAKVIALIRKAIANFVIEEAIQRNLISFDGTIVAVRELEQDSASYVSRDPDLAKVAVQVRHQNLWGNREMTRVRALILENPTDYPLAIATADDGENEDADAWTLPVAEEETTSAVGVDGCGVTTNLYKTKIIRL